MQEKNSTLIALLLSGLFAILGTVVGGVVKGKWDVELAERKYQSDLVLKALESSSAEERLETLRMLVRTRLIKESDVSAGVDSYIREKQQSPLTISTIPQVRPAAAAQPLEPPIIDNARIYILATKKEKTAFDSLQNELTAAGFTVVGARNIVDRGRPNEPEVRYFNADDKSQAERIALYMQSKTADKGFVARAYKDARAKSGYIEIWLGR